MRVVVGIGFSWCFVMLHFQSCLRRTRNLVVGCMVDVPHLSFFTPCLQVSFVPSFFAYLHSCSFFIPHLFRQRLSIIPRAQSSVPFVDGTMDKKNEHHHAPCTMPVTCLFVSLKVSLIVSARLSLWSSEQCLPLSRFLLARFDNL